ncbi:MAG: LapA family protein [Pseudomonadota bacterium]
MHFLKTLFWVVLAVSAVIFSLRNWIPVPINLWAGMTADVKLPVLLLIGGATGFLPTYAVHRARVWRLHRRIDTLERQTLAAQPAPATPEPVTPTVVAPVPTGVIE